MQTATLEARTRTQSGKGPSRQLRRDGFIPAVAYLRGAPSLSLAVAHDELKDVLQSELGRNAVIDLSVDGKETYAVMVKDYTVHPVSRMLLHADFMPVDLSKSVVVTVPFRTEGRSKGELNGGTLLQNVRRLSVRCLPTQIPVAITAEVGELDINDVLKVADLTLAEGFELLHPPEQKLLMVQPPRVEETPEAEGEEGEEGAEGAEGEGAEGEAKEGAEA